MSTPNITMELSNFGCGRMDFPKQIITEEMLKVDFKESVTVPFPSLLLHFQECRARPNPGGLDGYPGPNRAPVTRRSLRQAGPRDP